MKIITIVGARPQFVKSSIVSKRLKEKNIEEIYIHTGQHYDENMSDIFFKELEIDKPKYNLHIGSGLHGEQTGKMLIEIEKILIKEDPELVLLYGDTNSTLAGALAASKLHFPIFHIEGGGRNHNLDIPEEINRILTDHVSTKIFTATETGMKELKREGLISRGINSGDVMLDRLLENINKYNDSMLLKKYKLAENKYYLLTLHRPNNTDCKGKLSEILLKLNKLDKIVVFPIHPRTKTKMKEFNLDKKLYSNILFIDPLGYDEMMIFVNFSDGVLTDSGGLQKEACFLGKKCITIFDHTPWIELEKIGSIYVWKDLLLESLFTNLSKKISSQNSLEIFGNGKASEKIVSEIETFLKRG